MAQPSGSKIKTGDPFKGIPAADWNSFVDAANYVKDKTGTGIRPGSVNSTGRSTTVVSCKNSTGVDLKQFHIVGFNARAHLFNPKIYPSEFRRKPMLVGSKPTCDHVGRFGVVIQPMTTAAPNNIGEIAISGIVACRVLICDSSHEYCDVLDDDTTRLISVSTPAGGQIITQEAGLGEKWCLIRLSNKPEAAACVSTCTTEILTTTTTTTGTTSTSTTGTTGTTSTSTTTGTTGTTTPTTCPSFVCSANCEVSFDVVTEVCCHPVTNVLKISYATICLPSSQVSLGITADQCSTSTAAPTTTTTTAGA